MWNFQRIICIWICCVSCMFGTTQLSSLVQAVPYEYFDDHDQSFYDLDTEQIQAKYDTRLLSQQMLKTEQQQHLESKKDSHITKDGVLVEDSKNIFNIKNHNDAGGSSYILTKLKSNDAQHHHHAVDDDWLEETATITSTSATSASAVTEKEEIHLPRAASCYTNGHKYTHGQKVPRLDSCEVCLCMDGEIFCWWEKCDKKPATQSTIYDDYSTRYEESSTTRIQLNPKTTYRTTLKPMKKPKIIEDYKYDDDDSAEIREMQQEYEGIKEQLKMRKQQQHKTHNKQMVKKKIYQQYEEEKHKKLKEQQNIKKQQQQEEQQQLEQKQHKANDHHHVHNKNNNHHDYGGSSGTSKILNFPENLPSVLYYDYKTEEHHQHQHQHHEQHLKHQKQKQQLRQHEKELKYRQQQQQQQQQRHQHHHVNRHHEYGQNFNTYTQDVSATAQLTATPTMRKAVDNAGGPSTLKYFSAGNDNIYNVNLQTDSDILPEPPTKKPKLSTASETETATTTQPTLTTSSTATITVRPLKKQNFSPWDYDKPNRDKINNNKNNSKNNNKNESSEDIMDSNDQDDAFHRWLTSTETNNKKTNSSSSYGGGSSDIVAVIGDGNSDYNIEDKNYENIDIDIEARAQPQSEMQLLSTTAKTIASVMTTSNAIEAATTIYDDDAKAHRNFENSRMTKYEQYFRDNNNMGRLKENLSIDNNNDITNTNNNNNNFSPFSNPYQNNNNMVSTSNNRHTISPSASISGSSSFASNEDNGVANVVNIDIMLTASSAELQQQQQQLQSTSTDIKATHPQQQQKQQQQVLSLQDLEHEKQISTQLKFVKPPVLISNTNDVDNNKLLSSITNNNSNTNNNSTTNIVGGLNAETTKTMGVNLLSISSNNNNNNSSATSSSQSSNDNFRFKHLSVVTQSTAQNFVDAATTTTTTITTSTPPTLSTTLSPERLCNVMGTLYKIGDVLPQDTGNCLQCICIDGSTSDDTPRVTCSPHNCPPLVLPDLFDATGY